MTVPKISEKSDDVMTIGDLPHELRKTFFKMLPKNGSNFFGGLCYTSKPLGKITANRTFFDWGRRA